jgi:TrmH family RNA methyltransferase
VPPPTLIRSSHNPRIRAIAALRDPRERRDRGQLLVDGAREIGRAIAAGVEPVELVVAPDRVRGPEASAALRAAERAGTPMLEVTADLLGRLAFGERDEGLLLVARAPSTELSRLRLPADPLVGVVEAVEKPGNLGAVVRSADGAGLDALLVADPRADPWNPNAIRASLGTVFSVPLAVAGAGRVLEHLRELGIRVVAARVQAAIPYTEADLTGGVAIVLGSEADGLTDAWDGPDVTAIGIPMLGVADSLNVSVSAAILFYEARRQRGPAGPAGGG